MPWIRMPGLAGKVYVPEDNGAAPKKHSCSTCHACQWCDENRCRICRHDGAKVVGKVSMRCCTREQ